MSLTLVQLKKIPSSPADRNTIVVRRFSLNPKFESRSTCPCDNLNIRIFCKFVILSSRLQPTISSDFESIYSFSNLALCLGFQVSTTLLNFPNAPADNKINRVGEISTFDQKSFFFTKVPYIFATFYFSELSSLH